MPDPLATAHPSPDGNAGRPAADTAAGRQRVLVTPAPPRRAAGRGTLPFTHDLPAVRRFTTVVAREAGFGAARSDDLVLAVNEAVTNAMEHGGGHGVLRAWSTPAELVCEVINPSGSIDDPFPGHLPPTPGTPAGAACG